MAVLTLVETARAATPSAVLPTPSVLPSFLAARPATRVDGAARTRRDHLKRVFDIVVALALIVPLLPIWALVAILIKYETPGRVFFVQTRIGKNGRPFRMLKFRSMVQDAEHLREALERFNEVEGGVLFKMRRDPRVTRLGHVLRRSSLDETPQLLNILRGDMSIVGPRPPVPAEVAQYTPAQRRRLEIMPGLTCLWQVSGRSLLDFDEQVALDVEYIEKRSLLLDLWILIKTIPAVIMARGAF